MPSSTSNSEATAHSRTAYQRWVIALLVVVVLFLCSVEVVSRFVFTRVSRVARRIDAQYAAAQAIRQGGGQEPSVLLVGNSLLGASVDPGTLRRSMPQGWRLAYFEVEDTTYLDWYFGLKRLFAGGSRPRVVAIMLSPTQTIATRVRGEFFAQHLMQLGDTPEVARDLELHPTNAAGMVAGRLSHFYGVRAEIRNWLLLTIMPSFEKVASMMTHHASPQIDDNAIRGQAAERLRQMNELAAQYHAKLVWILPTLLEVPDGSRGLLEAAQSSQVPVLVPIPSGGLPEYNYSDGFHLAQPGQRAYMQQLVPLLRKYLTRTETAQAQP